jgi:hypothetical protein
MVHGIVDVELVRPDDKFNSTQTRRATVVELGTR